MHECMQNTEPAEQLRQPRQPPNPGHDWMRGASGLAEQFRQLAQPVVLGFR